MSQANNRLYEIFKTQALSQQTNSLQTTLSLTTPKISLTTEPWPETFGSRGSVSREPLSTQTGLRPREKLHIPPTPPKDHPQQSDKLKPLQETYKRPIFQAKATAKATETMPSTRPNPPNTQTTTHLHASLSAIKTFTPKLDTILLRPGLIDTQTPPLPIPCLLLEGARLANQLIEDLIAFDLDGRIQSNVPRLPIFRAGVDARAFVELYEAFNRECIDGVVREGCKEKAVRERAFWGFWHALERSVGVLMGYLGQRGKGV